MTTVDERSLSILVICTCAALAVSCAQDTNCPPGQISKYDGCITDGPCTQFDACVAETCAGIDRQEEPLAWSACVESNCEETYGNCPKADGLNCEALNSCVTQCGEDDETCQQECRENAGQVGTVRLGALRTCQEANCNDAPNPRGCLLKNCGEELQTCLPGQFGDATCAEVTTCNLFGGDSCDELGTKSAQITSTELSACAESNECLSFACVVENCTDLATSCGITGVSSCRQVEVCLSSVNSQAEAGRCLTQIEPGEAAANHSSLQACRNEACDGIESTVGQTRCADTNCRDQRSACGLTGDNTTCSDMWACASGQRSDCQNAENFTEQLYASYIYEGSGEAQIDFFELMACAGQQCPDQDNSCIQNSCSAETSACGIDLGS
jgi:hypothetical protein